MYSYKKTSIGRIHAHIIDEMNEHLHKIDIITKV